MNGDIRLSLDEVYELAKDALVSSGAARENAVPVAESIRQAEADSLRNIGLGYLPLYCEHLRCGKVDGKAVPEVVQTAPGAIYVDAKEGFAHPAIELGRARLLEMVRTNGVAAMGVGNSYACGVLGHLIEPLAGEGYLALMFANAPAIIAPWGGRKPVFGTNPMAAAVPSADRPPVVFDQSSSLTAKVTIFERQAKGEELEPGWAIDPEGLPTLDPSKALQGSMLPFGGYKGYNLALLVETLAAGLTGANWSYVASAFNDNLGGPPRVGQFMLCLDPTLFGDTYFHHRIEELFCEILGQEGTRLPNDKRLQAREKSAREGVLVDRTLLDKLKGYMSPP